MVGRCVWMDRVRVEFMIGYVSFAHSHNSFLKLCSAAEGMLVMQRNCNLLWWEGGWGTLDTETVAYFLYWQKSIL